MRAAVHSRTSRHHRRRQGEPLKKVTYQLPESTAEAIRGAVEAGEAPSANAFVERAVEEYLRQLRLSRLDAAYAEAAEDPVFMEELKATDAVFDATAADGLR